MIIHSYSLLRTSHNLMYACMHFYPFPFYSLDFGNLFPFFSFLFLGKQGVGVWFLLYTFWKTMAGNDIDNRKFFCTDWKLFFKQIHRSCNDFDKDYTRLIVEKHMDGLTQRLFFLFDKGIYSKIARRPTLT